MEQVHAYRNYILIYSLQWKHILYKLKLNYGGKSCLILKKNLSVLWPRLTCIFWWTVGDDVYALSRFSKENMAFRSSAPAEGQWDLDASCCSCGELPKEPFLKVVCHIGSSLLPVSGIVSMTIYWCNLPMKQDLRNYNIFRILQLDTRKLRKDNTFGWQQRADTVSRIRRTFSLEMGSLGWPSAQEQIRVTEGRSS